MEEFKKLGLSQNTINALKKKGFTKPTPIQEKVIPLLLEGKLDVIGQSQTGTGKTASFALPILEKIKEKSRTVQAIVLTPTRELALQVSKEIISLKGEKEITTLAVYGGSPIGAQIQKLKRGVDIVVGTPGRVMDLQDRKCLRIENVKYAVLDEADEMLNMGFEQAIQEILKNTPKEKSMLLFSATMPKPILKIAEKYMKKYKFLEIEKNEIITNTVKQIYYEVDSKDKVGAIKNIIDNEKDFHGIIFCNTKVGVDALSKQLSKMGYKSAGLHGDITQNGRERILQQLKNNSLKILVATDVAARGIDVNDLTHVINFSLPQSPELYIHRIGRTGRAGKKGISITLIIPSEKRSLNVLERINNCEITKKILPSKKEILENQENQLKKVIEKTIKEEKDKFSKYDILAKELLEKNNAEEIISAILKITSKKETTSEHLKEIIEPKRGSSNGYEKVKSRRVKRRTNQRIGRSRSKEKQNKFKKEGKPTRRKNPYKKGNNKFKKSSTRHNFRRK